MASYQARQRDPLLDQNVSAMLERRGRELLGVGLVIAGLIFVAMLGSYSPEDPGWMVATDEAAQQMMGRFGAAVASTLIIIGGKGAWVIPMILIAWGVRFILHRGSDRALGRIVFAVIAVALASVYAATLVPGTDWAHSFGLGLVCSAIPFLARCLGLIPVQAGIGLKLMSLFVGAALVGHGPVRHRLSPCPNSPPSGRFLMGRPDRHLFQSHGNGRARAPPPPRKRLADRRENRPPCMAEDRPWRCPHLWCRARQPQG